MGHNMQSTAVIIIPVLATEALQVHAHRNNLWEEVMDTEDCNSMTKLNRRGSRQ